jgi:hypothetical protein
MTEKKTGPELALWGAGGRGERLGPRVPQWWASFPHIMFRSLPEVAGHQGVELAKAVGDRTPVETGGEFVVRLNILRLSEELEMLGVTGRKVPRDLSNGLMDF